MPQYESLCQRFFSFVWLDGRSQTKNRALNLKTLDQEVFLLYSIFSNALLTNF